jgi:hypothetical protein
VYQPDFAKPDRHGRRENLHFHAPLNARHSAQFPNLPGDQARACACASQDRDRKGCQERQQGELTLPGPMVNLLSDQLAQHKLHVAETYITKAGLREFRDER